MKNTMINDMTRRYAEVYDASDTIDKNVKCLYFWTMSTLESYFWGLPNVMEIRADLYVGKHNSFLVINEKSGNELEFSYYTKGYCTDEILPKIVQQFVSTFNDWEYPIAIAPTWFFAHNFGIWKRPYDRKKFCGYYHVDIVLNMLPDREDDHIGHLWA